MTQNVVDFSDNPTGAELMDDYLAKDQQNVLTSNSGVQRPSYAVRGTKWLDMSVIPWLWRIYDGISDVVLGTVNPSTHVFTPAGVDSKQDIANLSQTLDTSTTKYPSNNAVKTAIDAIVPPQAGNAGKFLMTDGTTASWGNAAQKDKNEVIEATWTFGASDLGNLEGGQIQLKMDPEHDSYTPMIIDACNGMGRIYGGPADNLKVFNFNFSDGLLTIPGEVLATDISIHAATTAYVRNVTRPNYGGYYIIQGGTFVAPADGWIGIYGNIHHNLYFTITCDSLEMVRGFSTTTTGIELRYLIPVVAGKTYVIFNNAESGHQYFVPNMGGI